MSGTGTHPSASWSSAASTATSATCIAVSRALRSVTPARRRRAAPRRQGEPGRRRCRHARQRARASTSTATSPGPGGRWVGVYDSGPRSASEPETRALRRLILRERPQVSVWFHQHLNFVDLQAGGDEALMRGLRPDGPHARRPLPRRCPAAWRAGRTTCSPDASAFRSSSSPAGALPARRVRAHVRAVLAGRSALVERLDLRRVLLVDRLALELHRRGQLRRHPEPVAPRRCGTS